MGEQQKKEQMKSEMSPFCEALMNISGEVTARRELSDAAILLCSDGKLLGSRQCGLYPDVLRMVYTKMKQDDKFAELILDASRRYACSITSIHKPFKEDYPLEETPENSESIN